MISTISSILEGYSHTVPERMLLDTVIGAVGAGNFSYWQLGHAGPLLVELHSLSGDADLYVADNIRFDSLFCIQGLSAGVLTLQCAACRPCIWDVHSVYSVLCIIRVSL